MNAAAPDPSPPPSTAGTAYLAAGYREAKKKNLNLKKKETKLKKKKKGNEIKRFGREKKEKWKPGGKKIMKTG